jgi:hypothetical protein
MASTIIGLLLLLLCSVLSLCQALPNDDAQVLLTRRKAQNSCLPCHIVRPQVSFDDDMLEELPPIMCVTKRPERSYRESFEIDLTESFLVKYSHLIDAGDAFVCIEGGYVDVVGRVVVVPPNDSNNASSIELLQVTSFKQQQQHDRELQQSSSVTTPQRAGTKRLLVVRIISLTGQEPAESVDAIEGAIFGTGINPEAIPFQASVVKQYAAVSHGKLHFVPAVDTVNNHTTTGVVEVIVSLPVEGAPLLQDLVPEVMNATEAALGPLDELADAFIFCLPDGATINGKEYWIAISIHSEPVSLIWQ